MASNYETNADGNQKNDRTRERNRTLDWEGIESEDLRTLKQSRGALKGNVAKAQNEIREFMRDPSNVDQVKRKFEELKLIVDDFNKAHIAYHEKLTNEHEYF